MHYGQGVGTQDGVSCTADCDELELLMYHVLGPVNYYLVKKGHGLHFIAEDWPDSKDVPR
jgi:hypothetical protein